VAHLAGMEFHFDISFSEIELEEAEYYLKQIVSKYSNIVYNQQCEIYVQLSEGSLKAKLVILGAIYIGIGQYGSFRSGIDHMIQDAKSIKALVTTEIIKNGLSEADIIESKKSHCDPDRIRRVLLAIDRLESKKNIKNNELKKELSKIRTSVTNICNSLSDEDKGLLASSISQEYWPHDREFPHYIERYKLVAREEDIVRYPIESIDQPRVSKSLQLT